MEEGDSMDIFLTEIKDLKEQLIAIGEELPDSSFVNIVLDGLPDSYQSFSSTFKLMTQGNPNAIRFDALVTILLQEDKSRKNRAKKQVADQAFVASQRGNASQKLRLPRVAISQKRLWKKVRRSCFASTARQLITSLRIVQRSRQRRQRREKQAWLLQKQPLPLPMVNLQILCRMKIGLLV